MHTKDALSRSNDRLKRGQYLQPLLDDKRSGEHVMGITGHAIQFHLVCGFYILPELNLIYPCSCLISDKAVVAIPGKMEAQGATGSRK